MAIHYRHSAAPARAGAVRRVPGSIPPAACAGALAPRRLRVPDLTPSKRQEGVRSGTLWLYSASKTDNRGDQSGNALGNPEPPPAKPRPRFQVPQTPPASHLPPPRKQRRTRRTNGQGMRLVNPAPRRANNWERRRRCSHPFLAFLLHHVSDTPRCRASERRESKFRVGSGHEPGCPFSPSCLRARSIVLARSSV